MTILRYLICNSDIIDGVDAYFDNRANEYTADLSRATLYDTREIALAGCFEDDIVVEIEVTLTIKPVPTQSENHAVTETVAELLA